MRFQTASPVRIPRLNLHRRMIDIETIMQFMCQIMQEIIPRMSARHDQMYSQRRLSSTHRPYVQIVDIGHSRPPLQICAHHAQING